MSAHHHLVVDGNNLLMRAVKVIEHTPGAMSSGDVDTGALHIFIQSLARYVRHVEPGRMIVCWDGGRSAHRLDLFPEYKAHRPQHEEDAEVDRSRPFALAKEFLAVAGIAHIERKGVEADDIIAGLWWNRSIMSDVDVLVILSGDKDMLQLVGRFTEQIRPPKAGEPIVRWTPAMVEETFGCTPERLPLVMALTGDAIDGIPGVRGIGPKKAVKALEKAGWDLEALLLAPPPLIAGCEDQVRLNYRLVDLRSNAIPDLVGAAPRFEPTRPGGLLADEMRAYLLAYDLQTTLSKWEQGSLWVEAPSTLRLPARPSV